MDSTLLRCFHVDCARDPFAPLANVAANRGGIPIAIMLSLVKGPS